MTRIGVVAIARPTFDVQFAQQMATAAWQRLAELGHELVGSPDLILDAEALDAATSALSHEPLDALVIIQATFADATLAAAIADANPAPVLLWAIPEARTGGRLRLNSFCGINLAGYRLTREGRRYRFLYLDPGDATTADAIAALLAAPLPELAPVAAPPSITSVTSDAVAAASDVRARLAASTVGIVGERPEGFEPCDYDADVLTRSVGVTAETATLAELFESARWASDDSTRQLRVRVGSQLDGVENLDPEGLDRSLRLHLGLRELIDERGWSGVATRCWPECFTEFGAACCSPHSLLNDDGIPGCCEADAYGTVTSLILQWLGDGPAFVADLVDFDLSDQTGALWHCGMAPLAMANPNVRARATIHTNRRMPLLNEFPLRPGRVTIARLSQSRGLSRLTIGGGEMLDAPLPYAGTAGVIRFDRSVEDVMETIMTEGHEHHYGIVYGDVRPQLHALAAQLRLPVIHL
ncbi:MAG: L-fucose isomerase-like protein [Ilumatobacter sp.]|jgi:L-fucose isomerase-like protein